MQSITNPSEMFDKAGVTNISARATAIDAVSKIVRLSDGRSLRYDKMILSTGARPFVPPIEGTDVRGVFFLRTANHAMKIREHLETERPRNLVGIGAGFINLETFSLLVESKPEAYRIGIVEVLDHPLPLMLDAEMAAGVTQRLSEKGFALRMGRRVSRILGRNGSVCGVELDDGSRMEADLVLISAGAKPDLELAVQAGLKLGRFGVQVNEFLESSNPDILAAGDCAEKVHYLTRRPVASQLRGPAVIQGRLAAKRLAGYAIPFPGVLNNCAVRLFDLYVAATGLTEKCARAEGFDAFSVRTVSRTKHGMIAGAKPWTLQLVFDRQSQRLIGGQIVSEGETAVKEIDAINALILGNKTIGDLTTLISAGHPDCSSEPSLEPIAIAAENALQRLRGS